MNMNYDSNSHELINSVRDTGIGIEVSQRSELFHILGKIRDIRKKFTSGIGLGLHICKKLCEKFDGNIRVEDNYEQGTSFVFTFKTQGPVSIEPSPISSRNREEIKQLSEEQKRGTQAKALNQRLIKREPLIQSSPSLLSENRDNKQPSYNVIIHSPEDRGAVFPNLNPEESSIRGQNLY